MSLTEILNKIDDGAAEKAAAKPKRKKEPTMFLLSVVALVVVRLRYTLLVKASVQVL